MSSKHPKNRNHSPQHCTDGPQQHPAALVEQYKVSEEHWRDVSRHHDVRSDGSPPEVHYADLHLYVLAEKNIRNMWGVNALDAAIGKAFGG